MVEHEQDLTLADHPPFLLGDIRVAPPALSIHRDGGSHRIEAKVMQVLMVLASQPGQIVSRQG